MKVLGLVVSIVIVFAGITGARGNYRTIKSVRALRPDAPRRTLGLVMLYNLLAVSVLSACGGLFTAGFFVWALIV